MIILKATTESLQIVTSTAAAIDLSVSYTDITTTTFGPSSFEVKITSATTTSIVAAPAASTQRQVKLITITNRDGTLSSAVTIQKNISSVLYNITPTITLLIGETVQYMDGQGWIYYSATGAPKGNQTAAGSNTQLQFNNAGVLAGDSDLTWNNSTNTLALGTNPQINMSAVASTPATPGAGTLSLYAQAVAGKMQLAKVGPDGNPEALQAALWQNNTVFWTPGVAAGVYQGTSGSNLGTAALVLPTTTNLYTAMRRSTFASVVTTTNQQVGIRTENMFWRGNVAGQGGFLFVCRFGFTSWTAGDRLFVGLTSGTTAVVTVQPSTVASTIGFAIEAADTAITFLHTDGTPTAVKDVISGQPALANNNAYDAYIYARPNDSTIYYRLDNALTGAILIDTSITATLPVNTTMLAAQAIMSNGANTVVGNATLGVNRLYVETNR
ncbi:MAG: PHG11b 33 [Candidatus Saccharibacteria bacterium]|nr:PHG11b 33 [Candidatus Saccharibacteria bacterium]